MFVIIPSVNGTKGFLRPIWGDINTFFWKWRLQPKPFLLRCVLWLMASLETHYKPFNSYLTLLRSKGNLIVYFPKVQGHSVQSNSTQQSKKKKSSPIYWAFRILSAAEALWLVRLFTTQLLVSLDSVEFRESLLFPQQCSPPPSSGCSLPALSSSSSSSLSSSLRSSFSNCKKIQVGKADSSF